MTNPSFDSCVRLIVVGQEQTQVCTLPCLETPAYYKTLFALDPPERRVFYFQVSTGARELSVPTPRRDVLPWDAHRRDTVLPWHTLCDVLRTILAANGTARGYAALPTHTFISYDRDDGGGRRGCDLSPWA
jgi:hypothetical protein